MGCRSRRWFQRVFVLIPIAETPAPHGSTGGLSKLRYTIRFQPWGGVAPCTHAVPDTLQYKKSRALASCTTHSRPSCSFMPVMALHVMMVHRCVLIASSRSPCTRLLLAGQPTSTSSSALAYLANFVLGHSARNIALVLEDKQACPGKTLHCQLM